MRAHEQNFGSLTGLRQTKTRAVTLNKFSFRVQWYFHAETFLFWKQASLGLSLDFSDANELQLSEL